MKKFLTLFLLLLSVCVAADTEIRIVHTNDTHARIVPVDSKSHGDNVSGAGRRAALIARARREFPGLLVLDAGDMFQGTPFFNFFKGEACYRIASLIGYDATTLGNHELDLPLDNLQEKLEISGLRMLCCNVFFRNSQQPVFKPYHVFRRNGRNIAVIGSIGDDGWESIDVKNKAMLTYKPQKEAVSKLAGRLRPHVDLIILLSHSGFEADQKMAEEINDLDIIIGGHTHTEVYHPTLVKHQKPGARNGLNGTIVAQAGEHGIFLGNLSVWLDDQGKIATFTGNLQKIDAAIDLPVPAQIQTLIEGYHKQLEEKMQQIAGFSSFELEYPKSINKTHLLPMGNFAAAAMQMAAKADVCLVNSGGIRGGIKDGKITWGQIYEALPYDNTVVTFLMKGKQVKQMFDFIATNFKDLDGFQLSGVEGELNTLEKRSVSLTINKKPIDDTRVYRVCTSSFIANGNLGGDKIFCQVEGVEDSGIFMRDAAIAYLQHHKEMPDLKENPLKLVVE
ncbi:MAG: bifunctional metallophosphatase/5'-nucleotidase [Candidatus Rifleibacteriota bacterium]